MSQARLTYRAFKLAITDSDALRLKSIVNSTFEWFPPHYRVQAVCNREYWTSPFPPQKSSEDTPHRGCGCGIHAFTNLHELKEYYRYDCLNSKRRPIVLGVIAQWGHLLQYENVLRSQYAQIVGIFSHRLPEVDMILKRVVSGRLPLLESGNWWQDAEWVRQWAKIRNLIPQSDMVEADKLMGGVA